MPSNAPTRLWTYTIGLLLLALVLSCSGQQASTESTVERGEEEEENSSAAEAGEAPQFTLLDLSGRSVSLADSSGQVRLIDFWATWCAPCREEIPMFNELQEAYGDKGLQILAIADSGESADVIQDFAAEHDVGYMNLLGTEEIAESYGVYGLPTAFLVDGEGRIVKRYFGPKPRKVLERQIRELLELPPLS